MASGSSFTELAPSSHPQLDKPPIEHSSTPAASQPSTFDHPNDTIIIARPDQNPPPSRSSPPPPSKPSSPSDDADQQSPPSYSSDDQDAEGSDDSDLDGDSLMREELDSTAMDRTTSQQSSSPRGSKRKITEDEDDFIRNNPELYGLRRSHRAHQISRVVESSSDDGIDDDDDDSDIETRPARKRRRGVQNSSKRASKPASPLIRLETPSESESDDYGSHRNRAKTKKHRRQLLQSDPNLIAPPERFSSRRAAKVANYNEDDDEDEFLEDESELTPNYWVGGADDNTPAIDAVLNHRLKEGVVPDIDQLSKEDYEFFIKWQGKAHYHSTWEPTSVVSSYRGYRRLENYFRKVVGMEAIMMYDDEIAPEAKEQWNLDRERDLDAIQEHMQVERVIASQAGYEGTEYLVKWRGLFYDSSTWESAALVSQLAQPEIDRHLDRTSKLTVSNKHESNLATRSAYKPFKDQPSYIKNGQLREFQIKGINFLAHNWCRGKNVILADEMGLGKTVQTISFMSWLRHERQQAGPFLVVVPLSTMPAWAETFNHWSPDTNYIVYNGNESARALIREHEFFSEEAPRRAKFHVLLTTYEYILVDAPILSQLKWQFLAVDEAHRLKNKESQLYAKLMDFGAPCRLLITGTPVQNNLSELSALMNFLMPGEITVEENIDLTSDAASQKLAELTDAISPYMIRRTKQKVENDLPPKTERILRIELSDIQLEYYKNILTRNYAALNHGAKGARTSLLNIMMELKKASNHPFMFPNAEERILAGSRQREDMLKALITSSGKVMLLDQLLKKLKEDGHRVLIFSQMVKMLDILSDYLQARGYQHQRLDGTIAAGPRRMAIDHFNAPNSNDFCFLLSTRAGGLGINLMTADTVILFDSDWNPQADLQAMARAHRIGQKNPVIIYRFVSKDTVEEEVLERARNKLMLEFITIQRGVTDKDAKELSDRMARAGHSVAEPTSSDDINRILKKRGQKMFEQSGNQRKLEELDINAVLENAEEHKTEQPEGLAADGGEEFLKSFEYTDVKMELEWDEIIPKEQLAQLKAEEERKQHERFLAEQVEMNAPRKRKPAIDERDQRAAKKRARDLAAEAEEESDDNSDPKRPMNEREIRNLIRAYERYGSLEERGEELIRDAKLVGRDPDLLKQTLQEVIDLSRAALKEEQDRLDALEQNGSKPITKKDRKAVLFDYKGVKRLNAETIIERPIEMQMLKEVTGAISDFKSFRIPEAVKGVNYTCEWGAREDGMLCVGISRHGYGAWVAIRDDSDLGLGDKFYLEEHRVDNLAKRKEAEEKNVKSPGAVHLVRRANYLLNVLKDKLSNGSNLAARRAMENHHRSNKKVNGASSSSIRRQHKAGYRSSPAPSGVHRLSNSHREGSHHRHDRRPSMSDSRRRGSSGSHYGLSGSQADRNGHQESHRHERPKSRGHEREKSAKEKSSERNSNGGHGTNLVDPSIEKALRPIQSALHSLKSSGKIQDKQEKLKTMKNAMKDIFFYMQDKLPKDKGTEFENLCWKQVGNYWPAKTSANGADLKSLFTRQVLRPAAPKAIESRPSESTAPQAASIAGQTATAHTNGTASNGTVTTIHSTVVSTSKKTS